MKKSTLRNVIRFLFWVGLLIIIAYAILPSPWKTINRLEKALQELDIKSVASCFNPNNTLGVNSILTMVNYFLTPDIKAIYDFIPVISDVYELLSEYSITDLRDSLNIKIRSINFSNGITRPDVNIELMLHNESILRTSVSMIFVNNDFYLDY